MQFIRILVLWTELRQHSYRACTQRRTETTYNENIDGTMCESVL